MPQKPKKSELLQTAKGMRDLLPDDYLLRDRFLTKAKNILEYYGFKPIHTPYLEKEIIFTTAVGESTDIIEKQMYSLKTKGGDKLVLRPEGTASVTRAYLQHGMKSWPQPVMLYYNGFFYRHEKPQKGRRRELQQLGFEILGDGSSIADAIIIKTCLLIIEEMGLKPLKIHINSIGDKNCRAEYQKELAAYSRKNANKLCRDCKRRIKTNPLRVLDCKQEKCQEVKKEAPQIIDFLCQDCTKHFKELLEILDASEISYYLDHYLVRGLDYYTRTVFEIFLDKNEEKEKEQKDEKENGSSEAKAVEDKEKEEKKTQALSLAGGGRYDMLAKMLGNKDIAGTGCAIGIDRLVELASELKKIPASLKPKDKPAKVFFIQIGEAAKQKSLNIIETLRKARIPIKHSLSKDGLKTQLKIASKIKVPYSLIFGQKEALDNTIIVRNMKTASQEIISIEKLEDYLKKRL